MLWVDKYRPKNLSELNYHADLSNTLTKMVTKGDFPHLLFYGPPGAGKSTRISALLNEVYGEGVYKVKVDQKSFKVTKSKTVDLTLLSSAYHIEINPQEAGIYDRVIVQEVIKEMASNQTLEIGENSKAFKVVLIKEVENLTRTAQAGLRRTMEKYMKTCRIILSCENVSKVIDPLRSRCLAIRVPAPQVDNIIQVLSHVAQQQGAYLPPELGKRIALQSDRNLRKALIMLETCYDTQGTLTPDMEVKTAAWESFVDEICALMIEEQSSSRVVKIRGKIYELLVNCIPPPAIYKRLALGLIKRVDDVLRPKMVALAADYEYRMVQGNKPVIHLESFVLNAMLAYNDWAISVVG